MLKHGLYSKTRAIRPIKVLEISHRYDGDFVDDHYFFNIDQAKEFIKSAKTHEPKPNEYFFGREYKMYWSGTQNEIKE